MHTEPCHSAVTISGGSEHYKQCEDGGVKMFGRLASTSSAPSTVPQQRATCSNSPSYSMKPGTSRSESSEVAPTESQAQSSSQITAVGDDSDLPPPYHLFESPEGSGTSSTRSTHPLESELGSPSTDSLRSPIKESRRRPHTGFTRFGKRQIDHRPSSLSIPIGPLADASHPHYNEAAKGTEGQWWSRRNRRIILCLVLLLILILCVVLPVYFLYVKPKSQPRTRGGDGTLITTENGSQFTYSNRFGGFWVYDPDNPYDDSAQPNSWTPALNTPWDFTKNRIHGVSLDGLFTLYPISSPLLYQRYPGASEEWSLSVLMSNDTANGGLGQIEEHYKTFITEQDIAEIAGAGLTWVRLPIGFWAIETFPGEPFLAKTAWTYVVRVLQWCRKYGLRVHLALQVVPGSQNGSFGKTESINFLNGVMGIANAQRTLYYIRILTEFISQPEWVNVVPMLSILPSPASSSIGVDQLRSFYVEAHRTIREITGYGKGLGPYVVIDYGDEGSEVFQSFMNGADRVVIERHGYIDIIDPEVATPSVLTEVARKFCVVGAELDQSFGVTDVGPSTEACSFWDNPDNWDPELKTFLTQLVLAQMDALGDYFFWTWKVGESTRGQVEAPLWSYQLGLQKGWIPDDPRKASSVCKSLNDSYTRSWDGTYSAWMTGGEGAFVATDAAQFPWPPATISNTGTVTTSLALPTYTATGSPVKLPLPIYTKGEEIVGVSHAMVPLGRVPAPTPVAGCDYPDAWDALNVEFTPLCRRELGGIASYSLEAPYPTITSMNL